LTFRTNIKDIVLYLIFVLLQFTVLSSISTDEGGNGNRKKQNIIHNNITYSFDTRQEIVNAYGYLYYYYYFFLSNTLTAHSHNNYNIITSYNDDTRYTHLLKTWCDQHDRQHTCFRIFGHKHNIYIYIYVYTYCRAAGLFRYNTHTYGR